MIQFYMIQYLYQSVDKLLACLLIIKIYHWTPNGRNNFLKEFIKIGTYLQLYICNTYYSIKLITPNNNVCLYSILFSSFLITMWYNSYLCTKGVTTMITPGER
jgi:hypothetical protein